MKLAPHLHFAVNKTASGYLQKSISTVKINRVRHSTRFFLLQYKASSTDKSPHQPLPHTITLASLVKGRWIDGKAQTVALLRLNCGTPALFITKPFCRQDGGIASLPFASHHILTAPCQRRGAVAEKIRATTGGIATPTLAPHQPFQKPHYPSRFS